MSHAGRRRLLADSAALLGAALLLSRRAQADGLEAGREAPAFEIDGVGSDRVRLADLRGKVVLLHFWASWCPDCQPLFDWAGDLQVAHEAQGLKVLGIGVDGRRAEADAFLVQHAARFLVGFDPSARLPRSYGIDAMPAVLLLGRDGRVLQSAQGWTRADRKRLELALAAALAQR